MEEEVKRTILLITIALVFIVASFTYTGGDLSCASGYKDCVAYCAMLIDGASH
jgi:hypothetical protein